jgi:hypothetical protein
VRGAHREEKEELGEGLEELEVDAEADAAEQAHRLRVRGAELDRLAALIPRVDLPTEWNGLY